MKSMGFSEYPIGGDIVYTEPFCNLSSKRVKTHEILFEAYGANRLLTLSEPLVSMYQYQNKSSIDKFGVSYGMLVSIGPKFCLVIPIVNGRADYSESRRVNVGTSDAFNLMSKSLNFKYEHLRPKFSFPALKVLYSNI